MKARDGLIPYVIGAAGHRDLRPEDCAALKSRVRSIFVDLHTKMKSTPLLLLTGLAEGADQLVAEVALETNIHIAAILPMPLPVYLTTMGDGARETFLSLYERSRLKIELPRVASDAELKSSEDLRAQAYDTLAVFLADHSHSLIALWDGEPGQRGGTSAVVGYLLDGTPAHKAAGIEVSAPVFHISTPRQRHTRPLPKPLDVVDLGHLRNKKRGRTVRKSESLEAHLERFNLDAKKLADEDLGPSGLGEEGLDDGANFLSKVAASYRLADRLAIRYRRLRDWCLDTILVFSLIAVAGLEVQADLFNKDVLWLVYPAAIGVAFLIHHLARWRRIENKFYDCRALAEALRVQFYWELSGVCSPVCDFYLYHKAADIGWVVSAMRGLSLYGMAADARTQIENVKARLTTVLDKWVSPEADWFERKSIRQAETVETLDRVADWVLLCLVVLALAVGAALLLPNPLRALVAAARFQEALHFAIVVPSIALGLFKVWVEQAGYDEQSRNYRRMGHLFKARGEAIGALLEADRVPEATEKLKELGIKALEENSVWLLMHRKHPLKIFAGS